MSDTTPTHIGTLMCLRDAMLADNLDAIVRREDHRGPTPAFAHNLHLQRAKSQKEIRGSTVAAVEVSTPGTRRALLAGRRKVGVALPSSH
jgi:hypothetical protein